MGRVGVILAAGLGSRLAGDNKHASKPLTCVGGIPLLRRAVEGMAKAGCARVVIVVGHAKNAIAAAFEAQDCGVEIILAENHRYDLKNGVSVLAARAHIGNGDFVLAMADHLFCDDVLEIARNWNPAPGTAALLVDYKLSTIFDMDDATKVLADGDKILKIGKTISHYDCVDCGIFVCSPALMDAIEFVYAREGDASLSDGVQALAALGRMHVVDIGDGFWQDIDTPEMLAHAEKELERRQLAGLA